MDLSELIKSYTPDQKNVFTAFCINWPLIFTAMFVYVPIFKSYDFHLQLIFSASVNILAMGFSFSVLSFYYVFAKNKNNPHKEVIMLASPVLFPSFFILGDVENYELGYEHAVGILYKCEVIFVIIVFALTIIFIIAGFYNNEEKNTKNRYNSNKRR